MNAQYDARWGEILETYEHVVAPLLLEKDYAELKWFGNIVARESVVSHIEIRDAKNNLVFISAPVDAPDGPTREIVEAIYDDDAPDRHLGSMRMTVLQNRGSYLFQKESLVNELFAFIASLCLGFGIYLLLQYRFVSPIRLLHERVLARSNLDEKFDIDLDLRSRELNDLASAFVKSSETLRAESRAKEVALLRIREEFQKRLVLTEAVEKALREAGMAVVCFRAEKAVDQIYLGRDLPRALEPVLDIHDEAVDVVASRLHALGHECKNLRGVEYEIDESNTVDRIFEFEIDLKNEGQWLVTSLRFAGAGFAVIAIDVSTKNLVQRELVSAKKSEVMGMLTTGVANEFNNILAVILGSLETEAEKDGLSEVLDAARDSAQRGTALVSQLLQWSRGSSGERHLIDQDKLLNNLKRVLPSSFGPNYQFVFKLNAEGDVWVEDDILETTLINLTQNACDAMPDGGEVKITSRNVPEREKLDMQLDPSVDYIVFEVEDHGVGIPRKLIDKIFEPFFTTKNIGKGTGLGLSTALSFCERSEGKLHCISQENVGSTFRVYLRSKKKEANSVIPVIDPTIKKDSSEVFAGKHILVIDDERALLSIMSYYFRSRGAEVSEALNVSEARKFLKKGAEHQFDIVVADMHMPDGTGLDIFAHFEKRKTRPFLILTSGNLESVEHYKKRSIEPDVMISRPFRLEHFQELVEQNYDFGDEPPKKLAS